VKFGAKKTSPRQDPEQMEKAMLYTSLITNSMILQNIVDLTQTCQNLEKEEYKIHRECLERMSPYLTEQYKRFGEFFVDLTPPAENPIATGHSGLF